MPSAEKTNAARVAKRGSRARIPALAIDAVGMERLEKRLLYAAATYEVSVDGDSVGLPAAFSLRRAILDANAHPNDPAGPDRIVFTFPAGAHAITLRGALPAITDPVIIDGLSQGGPAYGGPPLIRLDAGVPGTNIVGLYIQNSGNTTIDGLAITGFQTGIYVDNASGGIGNHSIFGNYLGLSTNGNTGIGNFNSGLYLHHSNNNTISNNVISANGIATGSAGIYADGDLGDVFIGNRLGTDAGGTIRLGNGGPGIELHNSSNSRIGTDGDGVNDAAERNIIAGNGVAGIELDGPGATGNTIFGNSIGADAGGTRAIGNLGPGVLIRLGASHNQIGAPAALLGNLIANNAGIASQIGGNHFNDAPGVVVADGGTGNSIRGNSILNNNGIGIDLTAANGYDGVTINNANNVDAGPNHVQNYPILLTALAGNPTTISGLLNSTPNTMFTLDFYASAAPGASLFGDGQRYLGSAAVTTDASGNVPFQLGVAAVTSAGEYLTATATDVNGSTSEFSAALKLNSAAAIVNASAWTPLGPAPISVSANGPLASGRVADIVPDPSNANVMYLVSDGGGIWKTNDWLDAQPNWVALTDGESTINMGGGYKTLAIAPSNPQVLYAAPTGPGAGILRSGNGGSSWTLEANALFDQASFTGIAVDPLDANTLYVSLHSSGGVPVGVYKSTDGGNHWTNTMAALLGSSNISASVTDLVMDPHDGQTLYACVTGDGPLSGVYRSTNGGGAWLALPTTGGLLSGAAVGDGARIAIAPSNSQVIYAALFDPTLADANSSSGYPRRYVSTNGGNTWTSLAGFPGGDSGRYDQLALGVDPTSPAIVYAAGFHTLYRSTNSGLTTAGWTDINEESGVNVRFDQSNHLILAAERGVYSWAGGLTPFVNKQGNLLNTEVFTIALDPANEKVVYALASGQTGFLKYSGENVWNQSSGGSDVGKVLVSPANPSRLYAYTPAGPGAGPSAALIMLSNDGGATWVPSSTGLPAAASIYSPTLGVTSQKAFSMDPANPHRMVVGTTQVYETGDDAANWHGVTGNGDLSPGHLISAVAIAASDASTIYAATDDGKFWSTASDGAFGWQERDRNLPKQPSNRIVDFKIDPSDEMHLFAVTSADRAGSVGPHVWMTADGGASWVDISGNLNPENGVQSLAVDWRFATPVLYIGTVRGVYTSGNLGGSWTPFGAGMPNGIVEDLQLLPNSNLLAAGTYGRGVFEIRVGTPTTIPVTIGNQAIIKRDADPAFADITANGTTHQVNLMQAATFAIIGGLGDDTLTLDFSNGNPLPAGGINFDGGLGINTIKFIGTTSADTLTAGPVGITFANGIFGTIPITAANVQGLQFIGGSGGADSLNIVGGAYTVDADTASGTPNIAVVIGTGANATFPGLERLAALTINSGVATFAQTGVRNANSVAALSINGTGTLDLGSNDLFTMTSLATMQGYVISGYHSANPGITLGDWNGTGIISSLAKADPNSYTVGYATSGDGVLIPLSPGQSVVTWTVPGDANLDHFTDNTDFAAWRNHIGTGDRWSEGDFNFDQFPDNSDFAIWRNHVGAATDFGQAGGAAVTRASTASPPFAMELVASALQPRRIGPARHVRRGSHHWWARRAMAIKNPPPRSA